MVAAGEFFRRGWCRFPVDPKVLSWAIAARAPALATLTDARNAHWWRHGQTWFAGVNVLDNDLTGAVGPSGPLCGPVIDFIRATLNFPEICFDRAQISVVRPGYPQKDETEPEAAHRFRRDRDAAHLDGLLPVGAGRRRMIKEPHGFILGLPLTEATSDAAPLAVWEGSHEPMRAALQNALSSHPPQDWSEIDMTDSYHSARRSVFANCPRLEIPARPGEAILLHRLLLHGVAPWGPDASAEPEGRAIAYFRPCLNSTLEWLSRP